MSRSLRRHRNPIPRNRKEAQAQQDSFAVVALMRRKQLGLNEAAKIEGIDPETVARWIPSVLRRRGKKGDYFATPYDRIPREVRFLTAQGRLWITVRDSRTRSRIGQYMGAVGIYAETGDTKGLQSFKGRSFRAGGKTYMFITDPATIAQLDSADELQIEGLYKEVGAR